MKTGLRDPNTLRMLIPKDEGYCRDRWRSPELLLGGCGSDPADVSGAVTLIGGSCAGTDTGDVWFGTYAAPPPDA